MIPPTPASTPSTSRWDRFFHGADRFNGALLLSILVASPWLFGTTERWAVLALNLLAYGCGGLFLLRWLWRWRRGALSVERIVGQVDPMERSGGWTIQAMAVLTGLVLLFCLVAAFNARATFVPEAQQLLYHDAYVTWLPTSYDRTLTWQTFWNYLALACFFWSLRGWLLHPIPKSGGAGSTPDESTARLNRLLWVVALNATALAVVGIFQRLDGTDRLLWFRRTYEGRGDLMFASFAYRGNAAQYLNLCWPVMLGSWWLLREQARTAVGTGRKVGGGPHIALLPCAIVTAAAVFISQSVGAVFVALGCLLFATLVFLIHHRGTWQTRCAVFLVAISVLALAGTLSWDQLAPKLRDAFRTPYANPNELAENARAMAADFPAFGIGPGAFRALYHVYRADPAQTWAAFLHDDWFETRVTFGWTGSALILGLLALAMGHWFVGRGLACSWEFTAMLWVALWGCLAHAKFSFPLQIYSILLLFLSLCAVLTVIGKPR